MSNFRLGTVVAVALTFSSAAPALAHKDLNDWMAMIQRSRQQQLEARGQVVSPSVSPEKAAVPRRPVKRLRPRSN